MSAGRHNKHLYVRHGTYYFQWRHGSQRISKSLNVPEGTTAEERKANLETARAKRDDEIRKVLTKRDPEGIFRDALAALADLAPADQARVRRDWLSRLTVSSGQALTLAEAWERWLRDPNRGRAGEGSVANYSGYWGRFATWAAGHGVGTLQEMTAGHAHDYAADLWGSTITGATYNKHLRLLRNVWNVLRVPAGLDDNPWQDCRRMEHAADGRRSFTLDELRTIYTCADPEWRVMMAMGFYTALRLGDVACLAWAAVDLTGQRISLIPQKLARKGERARVTFAIHPTLAAMLRARARSSEWVFPEKRAMYVAGASGRAAVSHQFALLLRDKCGIDTQEAHTNPHRRRTIVRLGFHSLRHTFVTLAVQAGVPVSVVQHWVGHGSTAMTEVYNHMSVETAGTVLAALPDMPADV